MALHADKRNSLGCCQSAATPRLATTLPCAHGLILNLRKGYTAVIKKRVEIQYNNISVYPILYPNHTVLVYVADYWLRQNRKLSCKTFCSGS